MTTPEREDQMTSSRDPMTSHQQAELSPTDHVTVVAVPTVLGTLLIIIVIVVVIYWRRQGMGEGVEGGGRLVPPRGEVTSSYISQWLEDSPDMTYVTQTTLAADSRHSWPKQSMTGVTSEQLDSLESTASSGVLQRPGYVRRLETRLSEYRGLSCKTD